MGDNSRKISCLHILFWILAAIATPWIGGCGDFFSHKPTELQSENILKDLSNIQTAPDANIPMPEIYMQAPQILETKDGVKLFYFTKYHTVEKLSSLIKEQFGYKVSQSSATNQLIITCPSREDTQTILEFLRWSDVQPIQVKIDCLVSELYADLTMDQETTILIENLFGENITLGGKTDSDTGELLPAFPGASLREVARSKMGLQAGYLKNSDVEGHRFRAMVDMLESRGYLKILMNPTLEVLNGETAKITARDFVPLPKEVITEENVPYMTTEYQWVVDSLEITPHVFADGYIGLQTIVQISSKSTPEGVKQVPIITERQVQNKENRIRRGDSLVIGGIRKSEKRDVVRGVPFLKDIPVIGILFSSRDFEERAKEVIFILTPTISTGGVPREEMVEEIKRKHEPEPRTPKGPNETITEPLGLGAREEQHKQKKLDAEQSLPVAEVERARTGTTIRKATEKPEKAEAEINLFNGSSHNSENLKQQDKREVVYG